MTLPDADLLARLLDRAETADRRADWPGDSWADLRAAGVTGWCVPTAYGGAGLSPVDLLRGNEALGGACLTTAFILSQRDAAVRRVLAGPEHLKTRFLPPLAAGDLFLTIGVSQLTTSRQHGGPALLAHPTPSGGFRLDGDVPWVTGADRAAAVVVGATLPAGTQVLVMLPTDRPGVRVAPPMELSALCGSRTSAIHCTGVEIGADLVLAGPTEFVLGKAGGGGLETSCLALGLASAAIANLQTEAARRPDLRPVADRFEAARDVARRALHDLAAGTSGSDAVFSLRAECTRLALHATQAALTVSKGTGFVSPHPVQRWARQALFFLVWSCPRPVADGVLAGLLPDA
ncbi:acyl-CoA dehydrogenase family protein [Fimbriiglobus ruber]|uniref:Butyryl-CoA dehydrogenase n=1 Tax=Fimbriiglobus ruber TaxID=1908690 RepID=A0A225DBU0_9BACT|nr:acyl-CoA dehydrogenase family protein [Fimbriiglobus ruber]OWK34619.1 Butyryl-CoA dehydrogenase [Fimbriiglobus ruber]